MKRSAEISAPRIVIALLVAGGAAAFALSTGVSAPSHGTQDRSHGAAVLAGGNGRGSHDPVEWNSKG
ncbi:hypothetical protein ACT1U9_30195 [Streptomyces sp. BR1]|uniref:hypothetical protein n=1 Tax=Streptomyces sp. BR1 TaxID=1592323 RepID=UPI00402B093C